MEGITPYPGLFHFAIDLYFILLSVPIYPTPPLGQDMTQGQLF